MGPLSTAILVGCLQALKWLLWATAALLVILVAVQAIRGDDGARPLANVIVAVLFFMGGFASSYASKLIIATRRS